MSQTDFGANEWLVEELYQRYLADPGSVDRAWWSFFADYQPALPNGTGPQPVIAAQARTSSVAAAAAPQAPPAPPPATAPPAPADRAPAEQTAAAAAPSPASAEQTPAAPPPAALSRPALSRPLPRPSPTPR